MTIYIQGKPADSINTGLDYLERGQPAFAYLNLPRAIPDSKTPPKKTGPKRTKLEMATIALETSAERAMRRMMERATRVNPYSDSGRSTGLTNSEKAPR